MPWQSTQQESKGTRDYARHVLDRVFDIEAEQSFRKEILSDFHLNNYLFCLESGFSDRKQSALCSLMAHLFWQAVRTAWSVGVSSTQDVKDVTNYVLDTFFRHFKLYQYVYVTREEVPNVEDFPTDVPAPAVDKRESGLSASESVEASLQAWQAKLVADFESRLEKQDAEFQRRIDAVQAAKGARNETDLHL
ncbi:unnamed protein product [Vitrella brassicaformis CCMP3155]|uniref:Uncharacterized protein n=1 Tax=Vitrella brassicaformis (strain CCMP3155) TaxID=1169540 RepID=A0A0G4ESV8_VITBC|nr:unnamed protein product [Vitrella brassicaformis CCMP3155]|eukprot:CEM00801.1 unnamed protein product [Vitrella brassicaformis CCMP3155]